MRSTFARLGELLHRHRRERELDEELASHVQLHVDDYVRAGLPPDEARRRARLKLGNLDVVKERYREQRGLRWLDRGWHDVTYGARVLWRSPGFTIVATITLALGIGANAAVFSMVNAVLLQPLPFPDSDRLVTVWATSEARGEHDVASYPDVMDWRAGSRTIEGLSAYVVRSMVLSSGRSAHLIEGARVTRGFFDVLGVRPVLGRTLRPEEFEPGAPRVVVLGDGAWREQFGADPGVIGRHLEIDEHRYEIVGVMPPSFHVAPVRPEELYVAQPPDLSRGHGFLRTVGRLGPGATVASAQSEMTLVAARLAATYPRTSRDVGANVESLATATAGKARLSLLVLTGVVAVVLLIACTNVASLMLARGVSRQREMAVRAALGAGRGRIVRQLLTESLLLASAGGAVGLVLAHWTARGIALALSARLPIARLETTHTDGTVLGFTVLLATLTALLFGVAPALAAAATDLTRGLRESSRSATGGRGTRRARGTLVVFETALALVLLAGAGVLLGTLMRMQRTDPGFRSEGVVVADLWIPASWADDAQARQRYYDALVERLRGMDGVRSAALVADLPLGGGQDELGFTIVGRPAPPSGYFDAGFNVASAAYFQTMGIPIREGREFTARDLATSGFVTVVNETTARRFWPDQSPIGQQIALGRSSGPVTLTVVGVAGDVRHEGLALPARPEFFIDSAQGLIDWPYLVVVARTDGDAGTAVPLVRSVAASVDPTVPVERVRTLDEVVSGSMSEARIYSALIGGFAALALGLAAIGLYGLLSYAVSQRAQEMGIRLALGATPGQLVGLVLGDGLRLVGIGAVVGLGGGILFARALAGLAPGIDTGDPLPFLLASALLLGVGLLALVRPARRAARVDPVAALRTE